MRLRHRYGADLVDLDVTVADGGYRVTLPSGETREVRPRRLRDDILEMVEQAPAAASGATGPVRVLRVPFARTARGLEISWGGRTFLFEPARDGQRTADPSHRSGVLTAPMVGVVADVLVREGQRVAAYQRLAVVEAMKVMASVDAPFAGIVEKVHVAKGGRVDHGEPLVEVKPDA